MSARVYYGPARLFGILLLAPKWPYTYRIDWALYANEHRSRKVAS